MAIKHNAIAYILCKAIRLFVREYVRLKLRISGSIIQTIKYKNHQECEHAQVHWLLDCVQNEEKKKKKKKQ